jgi:hypothetical protein
MVSLDRVDPPERRPERPGEGGVATRTSEQTVREDPSVVRAAFPTYSIKGRRVAHVSVQLAKSTGRGPALDHGGEEAHRLELRPYDPVLEAPVTEDPPHATLGDASDRPGCAAP